MAFLKDIAVFVLGVVLGALVNGALVSAGAEWIPLPDGLPPEANMQTPEGLRAAAPFLKPMNLLFPWLAHAVGTFAGALVVARWGSAAYRSRWAYTVGMLFLLGGISMAFLVPDPLWFIVLDLTTAYLPPVWLALRWRRGV
jgi:hypothetical protein